MSRAIIVIRVRSVRAVRFATYMRLMCDDFLAENLFFLITRLSGQSHEI